MLLFLVEPIGDHGSVSAIAVVDDEIHLYSVLDGIVYDFGHTFVQSFPDLSRRGLALAQTEG